MAYEHERSEWGAALRRMTEHDRHVAYTETRRAKGIGGERDDASSYDHYCEVAEQ